MSQLLYAITDRKSDNFMLEIEQALKGGITCLQLREKTLNYDDFLNLAISTKKLCDKYNVPLIINDNLDVAIKCGASGVHVGQSDMSANDIRKKTDMLLGVTAKTVEQAILAQEQGADYIGVGAVFGSTTKLDAKPIDIHTLCTICQSVSIPVVAIGGISKHNILSLKNTGISGVALVSAIFSSNDIENECRQLLKLSKEVVKL